MAAPTKRPVLATTGSAVPRLPSQQLSMPAGYRRGTNQVATLRDVLSTNVPTDHGGRLTREQKIALTKARIAAQTELKIASPTAGRIDKARALDEVDRQTPLGQILVKIEHQTIDFLYETAAIRRGRRAVVQASKKRTATRTKKSGKKPPTGRTSKKKAAAVSPRRRAKRSSSRGRRR